MSSPFIIIDEITNEINEVSSKVVEVKSVADTINTTVNAIKTNTATNNSASATGTLSQKLSWIGNSLIGATENTGGSATAGTVMAKLNAIISQQKSTSGIRSVKKSFTNIKSNTAYSFGLSKEQILAILGVEVSGQILSASDNTALIAISGLSTLPSDGAYTISVMDSSSVGCGGSVVTYWVKYVCGSDAIMSYQNFTGDVTIYYQTI